MNTDHLIQTPPCRCLQFLFQDTRMSWIWLPVRVWLGWQWISAGWGKFNNPAWIGENAGQAISGFFSGALLKAQGSHPDVQGWYAAFITQVAVPHPIFFSYLITFGELCVGLGLILGAWTALAAFFGAAMNSDFLFAGTVSVNPEWLLISILLICAWRIAGRIGADGYVLPLVYKKLFGRPTLFGHL